MNRLLALITAILVIGSTVAMYFYASSQGLDVLHPQGYIAEHQKNLFWFAVILGMICLIPVFIMLYTIVHRYHDGNKKADKRYSRTWMIKPEATIIWGAFVTVVLIVLAYVLVVSTISVDPYKPIEHDKESKVVRVVALPWQWLFIYPEEGIATVNELVIPVDQPISFELTADAPMSSFWIPKLGGMIYVMEGMVTNINLMATSPGNFEGKNTEINGVGYSSMIFNTRALEQDDYDQWVAQTKATTNFLDADTYAALAEPSQSNQVQVFSGSEPGLFGSILGKFMNMEHHTGHSSDHTTLEGFTQIEHDHQDHDHHDHDHDHDQDHNHETHGHSHDGHNP